MQTITSSFGCSRSSGPEFRASATSQRTTSSSTSAVPPLVRPTATISLVAPAVGTTCSRMTRHGSTTPTMDASGPPISASTTPPRARQCSRRACPCLRSTSFAAFSCSGDRAALRIETRLRARADVGPASMGNASDARRRSWRANHRRSLAGGDRGRRGPSRTLPPRADESRLNGIALKCCLIGTSRSSRWSMWTESTRSRSLPQPPRSRRASPGTSASSRTCGFALSSPSLGISTALVVEPSTSRPFDLGEAVAAGRALDLKRGERRSWWTELEAIPLSGPGENEEA